MRENAKVKGAILEDDLVTLNPQQLRIVLLNEELVEASLCFVRNFLH